MWYVIRYLLPKRLFLYTVLTKTVIKHMQSLLQHLLDTASTPIRNPEYSDFLLNAVFRSRNQYQQQYNYGLLVENEKLTVKSKKVVS